MPDAQANVQAGAQADSQSAGIETKFDVGWQKLTKEQFLEAVTIALLDKVQDLPSLQSADSASLRIAKIKNRIVHRHADRSR
jgi:hypothetical protein